MSYILEALKKAEQQRDLGRVPGIETVHEQARAGTANRWLWLIAIVVLVNGAGLLVWLSRDEAEPATGSRVEDARVSQETEEWPAPQPVATDVMDEPRAVAEHFESAATLEREPAPAQRPELSMQASAAGSSSPAPAVRSRPVVAARDAAPSDTDPATGGERGARLPIWPRISPNLVQELGGSMSLDVHVYADRPEERFVLIDLRKYQEGDQLQTGARIETITKEGVILSYRGERFRVQAQR
jgi:general secretion pathway protein B